MTEQASLVPPSDQPAIGSGQRVKQFLRRHAAVLAGFAALTVLASLIAGRQISVGGLSWSDAPLHAMDGAFIHDLVAQTPSGSLRAWAEQYYLRHQCLGIVVYYPPLFALVEAGLFAIFGISVATARLTVLLFVIAAVWLLFLLGRELFGTAAGLIGAALTLIVPAGVTWSRQVMLEWPATFWIVLTVLAYVKFIERPGWKWGFVVAIGGLGAYLTKQTAVFILPVILLHAAISRQGATLRQVRLIVPLGLAMALIMAYGTATAGMNALAPQLFAGTPPWAHLTDAGNWMWYFVRTPKLLSWPIVFCLFAAVLAMRLDSGFRRRASLPALWAVSWWFISTVMAAKEERYLFFAVPAVGLLAGAGLVEVGRRKPGGGGLWILALLCGCTLAVAVAKGPVRLAKMDDTVQYLSRQPDADLVLVDAVRDGEFIFDVRTTPVANDRIIPMRASKFLYARAARTRYGYQQFVRSPDQITEWLNRLGIRYIVLEDRLPTASRPGNPVPDEDRSWDPPPRQLLRDLLRDSSRFELVHTQPLKCADKTWDAVNLVTYRYKDGPPRRTDTVTVSIPAMDKVLTLKLPQTRPKN